MLDTDFELGKLSALTFKDFYPERISYSQWTGRGDYPPLDDSLREMNTWIASHPEIDLINIETIVLPNIHSKKEEGSKDPELMVHTGGSYVMWHQVFRVWYIQRDNEG